MLKKMRLLTLILVFAVGFTCASPQKINKKINPGHMPKTKKVRPICC